MPRSYSFTGSPYEADQEEIQQSLRYAEALRQQSFQPNKGQLVSGHYVAPSITQGLAKLGQAFAGSRITAKALKTSRDLATQRQQAMIDSLRGFKASGDPSALLDNPETAGAGVQAMMAQQAATNAAALRPPTVANVREGNEQVSKQYDPATGAWKEIGRGGAFAPNSNLTFEQRKELAEMRSGSAQPYYQFLPGEDGYLVGNARTGQLTPGMVGGATARPGALSVPLQTELAAGKSSGKVAGASSATSKIELPNTLAGMNQTAGLIDQITAHPGLSSAVGVKGASMLFGALDKPFAGTDAADFMALKDQLGGKQFLEAFESLKGGGAITLIEGEKATNAIARMQTSQSETAFKVAAAEFLGIVQAAKQRAIAKVGAGASGTWDGNNRRAPTATDPAVDLLLKKYPPRGN